MTAEVWAGSVAPTPETSGVYLSPRLLFYVALTVAVWLACVGVWGYRLGEASVRPAEVGACLVVER